MGKLVTEEAFPLAEPAARVDISDEFFNYYLDPHPELAPDALSDCIEKGWFQDPADNVTWYLFVRIARDNPWLVRRYEALFRAKSEGLLVLLKILHQTGDEETRRLLERCMGDPEFEPVRAELQAAIEDWPAIAINPLARPVSSRWDLDLLWCEFRATGNTEPVLRIIDVFERPDHIRTNLENWLHATPGTGFSILATIVRKLTIRRLWKQASILCDADRREVLSCQDLDCHCTMRNMCFDQERTQEIAKLLPFSLYGEDAYLSFKAAARWSLNSHAQQHLIVFDLCESEAAKRTGRCRILLPEIAAYAALARNDLEKAFGALQQSLTPDPETDRAQNVKATAEWERLLRLAPDSTSPCVEPPPAARDAALRCIHATQAADTYRTKRMVRKAERTEGGVGDGAWEGEFARPRNFHVFQTMWLESGQVYDEWITAGGKHFRGPAFAPTVDDPSEKTNPTLLADGCFTLLRTRKPARFEVRICDDTRYFFFEYYHDAQGAGVPLWGRIAHFVESRFLGCDVLVWAEFETARLVKVVQTLKPKPQTSERIEIAHLFSCYDEPVSIVAPAFSLFVPNR